MEIPIDLPDWTKVGPIGPGDEGTDVWPSDAHYKGKAGIYLIETAFPKEGREDWYIGQSGDLLDRFKHYRSAEADPESANTTARVAGEIRECLQNDGEVDLSVMLGAKIAIPDYYYDDDGEESVGECQPSQPHAPPPRRECGDRLQDGGDARSLGDEAEPLTRP